MKKRVIFFLLFFTLTVNAAPKEIVLIRHADRIYDRDISGQFLSSKGVVRSALFPKYFLKNFGMPDYLFATKPSTKLVPGKAPSSYRPIQTLAPLANLLAKIKKHDIWVQTPVEEKKFRLLTRTLLTDPKYNNKLVLICWEHAQLNQIAVALGVKEKLPPFPVDVYDTVYVLQYNKKGELASFQLLKNQYPLQKNPSWGDIAQVD